MNKAAQQLGRLAKGKSKSFTPKQRAALSKRLAEARKVRHHKWVIQTRTGYITGLNFNRFTTRPEVVSGPLANAVRYTKAQAGNICGILGDEFTPMQEGSAK